MTQPPLTPDHVFRVHKDAMSPGEINALARLMNPLIKEQKITLLDLNEWTKKTLGPRPTRMCRTNSKLRYPPEFLEFWVDCPVKTAKGDAADAHRRAIERGHTALEIKEGLPVYIAYERDARAASKTEGKKHRPLHPATWLNGDRFLDESGADLAKPRKSELDLACDDVGSKIHLLVEGTDRMALQDCLDAGMSRGEIMVALKGYKENGRLNLFLYEVVEEINKGEK